MLYGLLGANSPVGRPTRVEQLSLEGGAPAGLGALGANARDLAGLAGRDGAAQGWQVVANELRDVRGSLVRVVLLGHAGVRVASRAEATTWSGTPGTLRCLCRRSLETAR